MSDDADQAAELAALEVTSRLAARRRAVARPARTDCADCGDPIEARRLAVVPNAIRCAECQSDHESR